MWNVTQITTEDTTEDAKDDIPSQIRPEETRVTHDVAYPQLDARMMTALSEIVDWWKAGRQEALAMDLDIPVDEKCARTLPEQIRKPERCTLDKKLWKRARNWPSQKNTNPSPVEI